MAITGIGALVLLVVSTDLHLMGNMMAHLAYIEIQKHQVYVDPWNLHGTIQRMILVRHDGGCSSWLFLLGRDDIMAPLQSKTEEALAAAFISNCEATNFRLQVLEKLESLNITIDSYGRCHHNRDGSSVNKVDALRHYKFSVAFDNSNEEDYVTEKFFQSVVAGSILIVVGAPNIQDFAPSRGSILHNIQLDDVESVARAINNLAANPDAYNQSVKWKYEGPSDSFKALVDMAAVHSSCRLCIHIATMIREKEEKTPRFQKRPCKCTSGSRTLYHGKGQI